MVPENGSTAGWIAGPDEELQWGRGRMAPENGPLIPQFDFPNMLQWGRGRMAPENDVLRYPSQPQQGQLQWGRGRMAQENVWYRQWVRVKVISFNGAGAGWPRKTADNDHATEGNPGMLQWGRGRMAPENPGPRRPLSAGPWLQWGRGRMAPENGAAGLPGGGHLVASMGPGPDGPGKH